MIYLDSCALVKLIREEGESAELQAWLDMRPDDLVVTSELARAEVLRVVRRSNHADQGFVVDPDLLSAELIEARDLLDGLALVTVDRELLEQAGALEAPMVRTLDAVHLASALQWRPDSVVFVTYDRRLATAAAREGLAVVAPA